jgi:hypothetical protein
LSNGNERPVRTLITTGNFRNRDIAADIFDSVPPGLDRRGWSPASSGGPDPLGRQPVAC